MREDALLGSGEVAFESEAFGVEWEVPGSGQERFFFGPFTEEPGTGNLENLEIVGLQLELWFILQFHLLVAARARGPGLNL